MARISPIIVGLAGIALAVLGTGGYLLLRPHAHARSMPAEPAFAGDDSPAAAPIAVAAATAPPPASSAPASSTPLPPAAETPPAATVASDPPVPAQQMQNAAVKKRALLMADHNQRVIQEADELAFASLQLPDATRAAVRQINTAHLKSRRDFIDANPPAWSPGEQLGANLARSDEGERARRAALREALGADGVAAFESAEYAAARRLRRQYSAQWAQELEEQAPLPEGLPPSPH
jgi:hypothetical protein